MRTDFRTYIAERRLLGLFYHAWLENPDGVFSIYRCDHLTETGRQALVPF
jgi:hypothetical protein